MGFVDPSDAYSLVEPDNVDTVIKYDKEMGKITGVKKDLKELAKENPYLVEESTDGKGHKRTPRRKLRSSSAKAKAGDAEERAAETPPVRL